MLKKPSELPKAVAEKVIHTSAALLPAKINATADQRKEFSDCRFGMSINQSGSAY
jgi:hypothetical protein